MAAGTYLGWMVEQKERTVDQPTRPGEEQLRPEESSRDRWPQRPWEASWTSPNALDDATTIDTPMSAWSGAPLASTWDATTAGEAAAGGNAIAVAIPESAFANPAKARRRLWWTLAILLVAVVIGGVWDGTWQRTHATDGFWSPPHVFVYAAGLVAAAVIASMLRDLAIRASLGPGFPTPLLRYAVPGALALLAAGITLAAVAGTVVDTTWHTAFGLDGTTWSFPQMLLVWSEVVLVLGVVACRLALRLHFPLTWITTAWLGLLVLLATAVPFMGPFYVNRTPGLMRALAATSVLGQQPPAQHALRIALAWNLTRTNPVLLLLAALWAGAALAFLLRLDRRGWVLLLTVFVWWVLDSGLGQAQGLSHEYPALLADPANWNALPLPVAAVVALVLRWLNRSPRIIWSITGLIFGLALMGSYHMPGAALLFLPFAAILMVVGAWIGEHAYAVVERPVPLRAPMTLLVAVVWAAVVAGCVDLILRLVTG